MAEGRGCVQGSLTAATTTTGGDALNLANPENATVYVVALILDITTQATGSATVDAGIAATTLTSADTLIDELDVGAAAIVGDNIKNAGTNGGMDKWGSTEYLTVTPNATLAGLVGTYRVMYVR